MKDVPFFIVKGFLESGKTSLIRETLMDPEFNDGGSNLVIVCEEGEEEYDPVLFKKLSTDIITLEAPEELNADLLERCKKQYNPDRVFVEFNGTWTVQMLTGVKLPKGWFMAQMLSVVDFTTFDNYWNNMRAVMGEILKFSDTVIFNRCTEQTDRGKIRRIVKGLNRKAQIMYEALPGVELPDEKDECVFDLSKDPIEIPDDDFGVWYMDAMDSKDRYNGRRIHFKGLVYKDRKSPKGTFIPGRMAMACCANDMAFVGFICKVKPEMEPLVQFNPRERRWVEVVAKVGYEYRTEYGSEGPVLTAESVVSSTAPANEVVYFS